jgi:hypothetical protein
MKNLFYKILAYFEDYCTKKAQDRIKQGNWM